MFQQQIKPGFVISDDLDTIRQQLTDTLTGLGIQVTPLTCIAHMLVELEDNLAAYTRLDITREGHLNPDGKIVRIEAVRDTMMIQEDLSDKQLLAVDDLSQVPDDYQGYVIETNDHGNQTLYWSKDQELTEVWSIV